MKPQIRFDDRGSKFRHSRRVSSEKDGRFIPSAIRAATDLAKITELMGAVLLNPRWLATATFAPKRIAY